jgi:Helix-turn-helix domain
MKLNDAQRLVAERQDIITTEALVMMMLLRRAGNATCDVPGWLTPSLPQLAAECKTSLRTVQRGLAHLAKHGWLKRSPGRGRGIKSAYLLFPDGTPDLCACRKKRSRTTPFSRAPRQAKKVTRQTPFTGGKGDIDDIKKVSFGTKQSQVRGGLGPRDTYREGVTETGGSCVGCGGDARRECRTCWECRAFEDGGFNGQLGPVRHA